MKRTTGPVFGFDIKALAEALAPLLAAEFVRILPQIASQFAHEQGQAMSMNSARKMSRCRTVLIAAALKSGALKGRRIGNRWLTTAGEVADWIKAGRPEVR